MANSLLGPAYEIALSHLDAMDDYADDSQRFYAEVELAQEHIEWLADRAAQAEYQSWLDLLDQEQDMKTSDMMSSKFLRKEDVGEGKLVTIQKIKKENLAREDDAPEYKFTMYFDEFEKGLVLNSTNIQLCEKALDSDDTDDWIGKQIVLYEDPNVSYGGKLVGGIRIRAVRKAKPAAPAKRQAPEGVDADDIPF